MSSVGLTASQRVALPPLLDQGSRRRRSGGVGGALFARGPSGSRNTARPSLFGPAHPTPGRAAGSPQLPLPGVLFTPGPGLCASSVEVNTRLIPVIFAQVRNTRSRACSPKSIAGAVPVHKVMNAKGSFARYLKDYLGLPADRKLLLSTAGPDNFMEMLWERGADLDFRGHGIDYWFPAEFSIYDNDGKCFQLFNARRQQLHAQRVQPVRLVSPGGEHSSQLHESGCQASWR